MGLSYNSHTNTFASDSSRPSSHLNIGVLRVIIDELITNVLNEAEQLLLDEHDPHSTGNALYIAQQMRKKKFLSTYNCAVCHKIPYAAVEKCFLKLVQTNPAPKTTPWWNLELLLQGLHGNGFASYAMQEVAELQKGLTSNTTQSKTEVATKVNDMLREFDKSTDNLFIGFAQTNSSIGDSIDKHYDVITPGTAPAQATPRGANLEQLLNNLESSLKMPLTKPVQ